MKRSLLLIGFCLSVFMLSAQVEADGAYNEEISGEIFVVVENQPEYPGGSLALHKFIVANIEYPQEAKENKIEGRVFVQFVVSKSGKVIRPKVIRGVHPLLDSAAIAVVNKLPDWKPGTQQGHAVNVYYSVRVNFSIPKETDKKEELAEDEKPKRKAKGKKKKKSKKERKSKNSKSLKI